MACAERNCLKRERHEDEPHDDREDDDRPAPAADHAVDGAQDAAQQVDQGSEDLPERVEDGVGGYEDREMRQERQHGSGVPRRHVVDAAVAEGVAAQDAPGARARGP